MKKITSLTICIALLAMILSSCVGTAQQTAQTTAPVIPIVTPAEAADDVDLSGEKIKSEVLGFTYGEDGRITSCEYTKDKVNYLATYNYDVADERGNVEIYAFGDDTSVDYLMLKCSDFDPSAGYTEVGGYYLFGFKTVEQVELVTETESESEAGSETADGTESGTETGTETETEAETETETESETETGTSAS